MLTRHDAVGNPVRDRPGLARTSPGEDDNRPGQGGTHRTLLRVEVLEHGLGRSDGHWGTVASTP